MTSMSASRMHEPEEPHGISEPMPHHPVPFIKVFIALVILTLITVGIGIYMRFQSEAINVLLALLIACIKGSLVAMYFMHLKYEGKLIYLIFLVPLMLCVILVTALMPDLLPIGEASLHPLNPQPMMHPAAHH